MRNYIASKLNDTELFKGRMTVASDSYGVYLGIKIVNKVESREFSIVHEEIPD